MMRRLSRNFWFFIALLCPVIPIHFFFEGNWYSLLHSYSLGMVFGIISYCYFLNALIISARIPYFDRLYGHDKVIIFHGYLATAAALFAAAHLYFKRIYFPENNLQINVGIAALSLFFSVIAVTVLIMVNNPLHRLKPIAAIKTFFHRTIKLDYSGLKLFHNLTALASVLMIIHVMMASPTAENNTRLGIMGLWGIAAIGTYLYHKFIRLIVTAARSLQVTRVVSLNDSVTELHMCRTKGFKTKHKAGQFGYFRILSKMCGSEEHPFTISSPPESNELVITIKNLGDYTSKLNNIETGAKVLYDGPYGTFTPAESGAPVLFIAGGIGITPFLSILSHWNNVSNRREVTLLWSARNEEEMTHKNQLEKIAETNPNFRFIPLVTNRDHTILQRQLLDSNFLSHSLPVPEKCRVYICGPELMRLSAEKALKSIGVKRAHINFEKFSF